MCKLPSVAALALVGLLLTGCVPGDAGPTPTPVPSSTPVFASEEEALAAAEAAYAAYQAEVDRALATYDSARLPSVATGDALTDAESSVLDYSQSGRRLTGSSSIDTVSLISSAADGDSQIYGCLDISATDLVDSEGSSVISGPRPTRLPTVVNLVWDSTTSDLLVDAVEVWDGDDFCN